jgi:hypothetical protein
MSETLLRVAVKLEVNGEPCTITVEPRTMLLDALRVQLVLTGTRKGCDRGEGACTVHVDGRRVLSWTLAAMRGDNHITPSRCWSTDHDGEIALKLAVMRLVSLCAIMRNPGCRRQIRDGYLAPVAESAKASHPQSLPQGSFESGKTEKAILS